MKKRILIAAAAALCLVSCDKPGISEGTPESSAAVSADITQTAGAVDMTCIAGDADGFTNGLTKLELSTDGRFSIVHSGNGGELVFTGDYSLTGSTLSLEYDRITTEDELFAVSDIYRDLGDTDKLIERVNGQLDSNPHSYTLRSGIVTPVGDEHRYRREAYDIIADYFLRYSSETALPDNAGGYGFFSSDTSLNANITESSAELLSRCVELMDGMSLPELSLYTPEPGFTEKLDISEHEWLIVVSSGTVVAAGIGESFDSEMCGISNIWYFGSEGEPQVLDGSEAEGINTLSALYEFYKQQ